MCGIAGIVDQTAHGLTRERLTNMIDTASHRGPDGDGQVLFDEHGRSELRRSDGSMAGGPLGTPIAGLAHRRLAILDLSEAAYQPMADPTGRFWIVLNGEVYNYVELRRELEQKGYDFRTSSDTEVVLSAYLEWGPDALKRFNGMWALAIFDRNSRELFCARDRFGVKPLYYIAQSGVFAFASEIKQLIRSGLERSTVNLEILADHLLWRYETHTNETFFRSIRSLPASTYVKLNGNAIGDARVTPYTYWRPQVGERSPEANVVEGFRDLLQDAVRLRLRSDVPVGVTLSGGLDSSSITCLAARELGRQNATDPLRAFTVSYSDPGYSEEHYAAVVAEDCHARRTPVTPKSADLEKDWRRFVWSMEEPFSGLSFYSNWKLYEVIRSHGVPVILNGQGGDELLLGYDRYRVANVVMMLRRKQYHSVWNECLRSRRNGNLGLGRQAVYMIYFGVPMIRAWRRRNLTRPYLQKWFFKSHSNRIEDLERESIVSSVAELQINEFYRYQLPHLLRHEDRVSMASGVESRSPFLDYRLFEYILNLEPEMLLGDGWSKRILRESMRTILPESIRLRTDKMGFDTPTGRLLADNWKFFADLLHRHREDPVVRVDVVERGLKSRNMNEHLFCSILSYLTWKELFGITE